MNSKELNEHLFWFVGMIEKLTTNKITRKQAHVRMQKVMRADICKQITKSDILLEIIERAGM